MTVPSLRCSLLPVRNDAPDARLIVLGPSLGTTSALWDDVAFALSSDHRVLRYDLPGHGFSPAATEAFTMGELAEAVLALVDSVGGGSFYYAGDSMGSAVGLTLAVAHPERVTALASFCAAAVIGTPESWRDRATRVRASGTASVVAMSAERWFAPGFLEREPERGAPLLDRLVTVDDESYALCCEALAAFDVTSAARQIGVPTVCIAGEFDVAVPPADVHALAALIPNSRESVVAGAGHLPVLEAPARSEQLIRSLFVGTPTAAGMTVRREVLGDAHVDAANAKITAETADFQEFITRYAWGEIWTRPGLDRKQRSLVTLASLVTGQHSNEIGMHVRAALTNGLTRAEISEAILHTAIYAGVPSANAAFAIAREVFATLDSETNSTSQPDSNEESNG
jgi:3-oxoadipate enol-lactonase/4-carboxymuconolactone decarboxylase